MSSLPASIQAEGDRLERRPPLKWAGGKRWLVPHLEYLWRHHESARFVEPFCGGLAAALGLQPERALLNDISTHAVNFYRWLQRGLMIELPFANEEETYYRFRSRYNELCMTSEGASSAEAAQIFYYLNRTGYNGLCRFNRAGQFNVPFGRYKTISYAVSWPELQPVLARWEFTASDFESVRLAPRDFVYADPPYDVEFRTYSKEGFTWLDQVRLGEWLAKHDGPVVLSNQATERVCDLYTRLGFDLAFLSAPRRISCTGDRTPAREVLATRNLLP